MRNPQYSLVTFLFCVGVLFLLFVGCTVQPESPSAPTFTVTNTPTGTLSPIASTSPVPSDTSVPTTRPTRRPTITIAPTQTPGPPTVNWSVNAVEIQGWTRDTWLSGYNGDIRGYVDGEWRDLWPYFSDRYHLNIPLTSEPTETPFNSLFEAASYSPSYEYAITCIPNGMRLYQVADQSVLYEIDRTNFNCSENGAFPGISWADNETVAFVSTEGDVYVWLLPQNQLFIVAATTMVWLPPQWSPDGKKLLIVDHIPGYADYWTYKIAFRNGQPSIETDAMLATRTETPPYWWDNQLIVHPSQCGASCIGYTFFEALTGEELFSYGTDGWAKSLQIPLLSPDQRWMITQDYLWYTMIDFENHEELPIVNPEEYYLEFITWALDSSFFYFTRLPRLENTIHDPSFPYGLLAYNPYTRISKMLLPNAIYGDRSADGKHVFVTVAKPNAENAEELVGIIYSPDWQKQSDEFFISTYMVYPDELGGPARFASWSENGEKLVYSNSEGDIWLVGLNGSKTQLLDNQRIEEWPFNLNYYWSPDDTHLLITFNERAWVITVSLSKP